MKPVHTDTQQQQQQKQQAEFGQRMVSMLKQYSMAHSTFS